MDFSLLLSSYATVWSNPEVLLMTFIGALGGVLLGAIPGMTATMGVALLIPFSFGMDLIPSIGLLLGIYCGGMYGGSISAILIHAPGTPAAAATLLDGYPMCKKGQAGKALSVAMFASFCGGVIGALVMTFLSPLVADMAMNFGPGEMFIKRFNYKFGVNTFYYPKIKSGIGTDIEFQKIGRASCRERV